MSASQKRELWERWKQGQPMSEIARTFRVGLWLAGLGLFTTAGVVVWQRASGRHRS